MNRNTYIKLQSAEIYTRAADGKSIVVSVHRLTSSAICIDGPGLSIILAPRSHPRWIESASRVPKTPKADLNQGLFGILKTERRQFLTDLRSVVGLIDRRYIADKEPVYSALLSDETEGDV